MKYYTIETDHFRLNYTNDLQPVAERAGVIFERLYGIFKNTYGFTLPQKTEVLVLNSAQGNGFAAFNLNLIAIDANDMMEFNYRGTHDWLEDVIAHEFAHMVSIGASFKLPSWMPAVRGGYFTHSNDQHRGEAVFEFPGMSMPEWLAEGIAQYESSLHGSDSWDSHRDMILRTRALSNTLLSRSHMTIFAGKYPDLEGTYNHGFSLVKYIAERYGHDKVVALIREINKIHRLDFDDAVKMVLGISGKALYGEWKEYLLKKYTGQVEAIGTQVYGTKINKDGFENFWPRFSPSGNKIYFTSNGKKDRGFTANNLYSYSTLDTVPQDKRIKFELASVYGFYSILDSSHLIAYAGMHSKKSVLPAKKGGTPVSDLFIDRLPADTRKPWRPFSRQTERQVSTRMNLYHPVFSPDGGRLACTKRVIDRQYLCMVDSSGKNFTYLYPQKNDTAYHIRSMYGVDWSPSGNRIAVSFIDRSKRKIGIYNTEDKSFSVFFDTLHDCRDPRFSRDGDALYFSSDRTGIFNIYRYRFTTGTLQRVTNVSGGAFVPDVSHDNKKLVYANYDADGFGIYLIDSMQVVHDTVLPAAQAWLLKTPAKPRESAALFSKPRPYSHFPRQFLLIPMVIGEQIVGEDNNPFKGKTSFRYGALFNLADPFGWNEQGTFIAGYFLSESLNPFRFFDRDDFINPRVGYDAALFGTTTLLPVNSSVQLLARTVPDQADLFVDRTGVDTIETLSLTHSMKSVQGALSSSLNQSHIVSLYGAYETYNQWIYFSPMYLGFDIARSYHLGAFHVFKRQASDAKRYIAPKGLYTKVQYEFWNANLASNENWLIVENGMLKTNFDNFKYNLASGKVIYFREAPWYSPHSLGLNAAMTGLQLTKKCREILREKQQSSINKYLHPTNLPSYYRPAIWLPGYTYYYRDTVVIDSAGIVIAKLPRDTTLLSGNGIVQAHFSYRFPLLESIDRKISFLYLYRLYGVVNYGGGAAVADIKDFFTIRKNAILTYVGAELRLETRSFSSPLAISCRWDYGLDRKAPLGGSRFTVKLGFDFEYWDTLLDPSGMKNRSFTR